MLPTALYGLTAEDLAAGNQDGQLGGRRLVWSLTDWGLSKEQAGWAAAALGAGSSFVGGLMGSYAGGVIGASVVSAACLAGAPIVGAALGILAAAGTAYAVGQALDGQFKTFYDTFETDEQLVDRFKSGQPFGGLAAGLTGFKYLSGGLRGIADDGAEAAEQFNKMAAKNRQILEQQDELARLQAPGSGATQEQITRLERSIRANKGWGTRYERAAARAVTRAASDQIGNHVAAGDVGAELSPATQTVVDALRGLADAPPSVPEGDGADATGSAATDASGSAGVDASGSAAMPSGSAGEECNGHPCPQCGAATDRRTAA